MRVLVVLLALALCGQTFGRAVDRKDLVDRLQKMLEEMDEKSDDSETGDVNEPPLGSEDAGFQEFKDFLKAECKLDWDTMMAEIEKDKNPVTKEEYMSAMKGFGVFAQALGKRVTDHTSELEALEKALENPKLQPEDIAGKHVTLLSNFVDTLSGSMVGGVCAKMSLFTIQLRIDSEGTSGFKNDKKCNNAGVLLMETLHKNGDDYQKAAEELWNKLDQVGQALRDDVRCLINDVHEFLNYIKTQEAELPKLSARLAEQYIDSALSYIDNIGMDMSNLMHSAGYLGQLMGVLDDKPGNKEAKEKKSDFLKELAVLEDVLKKMDVGAVLKKR